MKPTESLVQSRLKECFTVQIKNKWKGFVESLLTNEKTKKNLNKYKSHFGNLEIIKEADTNQIVLKLEGLSHIYEDCEDVDENDPYY